MASARSVRSTSSGSVSASRRWLVITASLPRGGSQRALAPRSMATLSRPAAWRQLAVGSGMARSQSASAGAASVVAAVACRALPAARVGEAPRLVRAVARVQGGDLAGGLRDPHERGAQLPDAAAGDDEG